VLVGRNSVAGRTSFLNLDEEYRTRVRTWVSSCSRPFEYQTALLGLPHKGCAPAGAFVSSRRLKADGSPRKDWDDNGRQIESTWGNKNTIPGRSCRISISWSDYSSLLVPHDKKSGIRQF